MAKHLRVETDGITTTTRATFDVSKPLSRREARELVVAINATRLRASFDLKIADMEPSLRCERGRASHPRYGSRAWYADAIIDTIARTRQLRDVGTRGTNDAALAYAMRVGYLAAEWAAKGWPDLVLGRAHRQHQRERSRIGVDTKRDQRSRRDTVLLQAVRAYQTEHPQHSLRTMAKNLLTKFGPRSDDHKRNIDALRKRITRTIDRN